MSKLVVCLDGTDQEKHQRYPTNIARIFDALGGKVIDAGSGSFEADTGHAKAKYLPGVGVDGVLMLQVLGKLFGDGIAELIVRGYTYLSRAYVPGDEIYLTGFSRGATAARALAGLIAGRGLLDPTRYNPANKNDAYARAVGAWYLHRQGDQSLANQLRLGVMAFMLGHPLPKLTAADFRPAPSIKAVAVFDTVSSLGVPRLDSEGRALFDFSICDTVLSEKVEYGFHALAADETRDLFAPTFWAARHDVEQMIFPGAHSNVGGGFAERGLSDGALEWMLIQLEPLGLIFDRAQLDPPVRPDPLDLIRDDAKRPPFFGTLSRARAFPHSAKAHASLLERWNRDNRIYPGITGPYRAAGVYVDGVPLHK